MSLAWGSLVVLLLLLPGVTFFFGLHIPEGFSRESIERSALGQLSGVLAVSLFVHLVLLILNGWAQPLIPPIDIHALLDTIVLEQGGSPAVRKVSAMLALHAKWIASYLLLAGALGGLLGFCFGKSIVPRVSGLAPHRWVFDLNTKGNLTVAYVLTNVQHEDRVLMYHGFLRDFALKKDGTFAYVVLIDPTRSYLVLESSAPVTRDGHVIGEAPASTSKTPRYSTGKELARRYLCIEGEDIANIVFDRYKLAEFQLDIDLEAVIKRVSKDFDPTILRLLEGSLGLEPPVEFVDPLPPPRKRRNRPNA